IVLGACDVSGGYAIPPHRDASLPRFEPERVRPPFLGVLLAPDPRAADLSLVAVDPRPELGGYPIPPFELLCRWRRHAAHLRTANADDLEIMINAVGTEERLDLSDQLVVGATDPRCLTEHRIAVIRELGGAAHGSDLGVELVHQKPIEKRGLIG